MADKAKQNKEIRIKPIAPSANLQGKAGKELIANAQKYTLSSTQQKSLSEISSAFVKTSFK